MMTSSLAVSRASTTTSFRSSVQLRPSRILSPSTTFTVSSFVKNSVFNSLISFMMVRRQLTSAVAVAVVGGASPVDLVVVAGTAGGTRPPPLI
ncbi:unnamed protein product [Linum trigynum]|uniref:Uncharacterized protein n=1 Tax=Linum trigynum TaxID=586398 RepID=A0AAV2FPI1_9ROSI